MTSSSSTTRPFTPPTFEDVCRHDLDAAIARIHRFQDAKALTWFVDWYGASRGVLDFAGLPEWFPLWCHGSHGVDTFDPNDTTCAQAPNNAPWLVTRDSIRDRYRAHGHEAYTIGSPFAHYRHARGIARSARGEYTLAFPAHSTHHLSYDVDWGDYIGLLQALPDEFQPVVAVLYWADILQGLHTVFLRHGIPVVTCGHMYDKNFIDEFYYFLSGAKFTTSNERGSHLFYSIEMDIPFFFLGDIPANILSDSWRQEKYRDAIEKSEAYMAFLYENCTVESAASRGISDDMRNHVRRMMGMDQVERRDTLRRVALRSATTVATRRLVRRATGKGARMVRHILKI